MRKKFLRFTSPLLLSLFTGCATILPAGVMHADNKTFLGFGYGLSNGEDSTSNIDDSIEVKNAERELAITFGFHREFPAYRTEANIYVRGARLAGTQNRMESGLLSSDSQNDTYTSSFETRSRGSLYVFGIDFRPFHTRYERVGLGLQGGFENRSRTAQADVVHKSRAETVSGDTTTGEEQGDLLEADDQRTTTVTRTQVAIGPTFVHADIAVEFGLLYKFAVSTHQSNFTSGRTTFASYTTHRLAYTFRSLREGTKYFGSFGIGRADFFIDHFALTTYHRTEGTDVISALTCGVRFNDAHEFALGVEGSKVISNFGIYKTQTPTEFFGSDRNTSGQVSYRLLF